MGYNNADQYESSPLVSKITEELKELVQSSPITSAAVLTIEGLPVANYMTGEENEALIAAVSAALYATGSQTAQNLNQGNVKAIIIDSENGVTVVMTVDKDNIIVVTAGEGTKLGLVFNDVKKAVRNIKKILHQIM